MSTWCSRRAGANGVVVLGSGLIGWLSAMSFSRAGFPVKVIELEAERSAHFPMVCRAPELHRVAPGAPLPRERTSRRSTAKRLGYEQLEPPSTQKVAHQRWFSETAPEASASVSPISKRFS